jgi:Holliday junction resolvase RusA-like endonuclease
VSWKIALQKDIIGFNPETASNNRVKRKKELKKVLSAKIGKEHQKILKRVIGRDLFIDVCFNLYQSEQTGSTKKDLDNLLKILLDVLSVNMVNGQDKLRGLGFLRDDSQVTKIHCERKTINDPKNVGFNLKISYK